MSAQTDNLSNLRARLFQHIVSSRFAETFGANWWENVLLRHMREEGQTDTFTGRAYKVALTTYGRYIEFENLDTSVLSTIVLFDTYFQQGKFKVTYAGYELGAIRQLHKLRNKIGHEENDVSQSDKARKATMSVLRKAVDQMDLTKTNPALARDILAEYLKINGEVKLTDANLQKFVDTTAQFEKAESLFQWNIKEAIPIYESLAEENYQPALEKLFYVYTKVYEYLDLDKTIEISKKMLDLGNVDQAYVERLETFQKQLHFAMLGDLPACKHLILEIKQNGIINAPKILKFAQDVVGIFRESITALGINSYYAEIHELEYNKLKALREQNDAEAYAETAYRMIYQKNTDFVKARRCADKAAKLGSPRGMLLAGLLALEADENLQVSKLISMLANVSQQGFLPGVELFAESGRNATSPSESSPGVQWILIGKELGSKKCTEWYNAIVQRAETAAKESPAPVQEKPNVKAESNAAEVEALKTVIQHQKWTIRVIGTVMGVLLLLQVLQIIVR